MLDAILPLRSRRDHIRSSAAAARKRAVGSPHLKRESRELGISSDNWQGSCLLCPSAATNDQCLLLLLGDAFCPSSPPGW